MMNESESKENQSNAMPGHSFEEAIADLETIIKRMSAGDQPLETSISDFERGVKIVRECQKMLQEAEQRVALLTKSADGKLAPQPFDSA